MRHGRWRAESLINSWVTTAVTYGSLCIQCTTLHGKIHGENGLDWRWVTWGTTDQLQHLHLAPGARSGVWRRDHRLAQGCI